MCAALQTKAAAEVDHTVSCLEAELAQVKADKRRLQAQLLKVRARLHAVSTAAQLRAHMLCATCTVCGTVSLNPSVVVPMHKRRPVGAVLPVTASSPCHPAAAVAACRAVTSRCSAHLWALDQQTKQLPPCSRSWLQPGRSWQQQCRTLPHSKRAWAQQRGTF